MTRFAAFWRTAKSLGGQACLNSINLPSPLRGDVQESEVLENVTSKLSVPLKRLLVAFRFEVKCGLQADLHPFGHWGKRLWSWHCEPILRNKNPQPNRSSTAQPQRHSPRQIDEAEIMENLTLKLSVRLKRLFVTCGFEVKCGRQETISTSPQPFRKAFLRYPLRTFPPRQASAAQLRQYSPRQIDKAQPRNRQTPTQKRNTAAGSRRDVSMRIFWKGFFDRPILHPRPHFKQEEFARFQFFVKDVKIYDLFLNQPYLQTHIDPQISKTNASKKQRKWAQGIHEVIRMTSDSRLEVVHFIKKLTP